MSKIIGIDLGTKRVGLAYSNDEMSFAFPLKVLQIQNITANLESLADQILLEERSINGGGKMGKTIVIGESKNFKGQDNPIMTHVLRLKSVFEAKGYSVVLVPEFMTSAEASRFQGDIKLLDASAATIILQSYLDTLNNNKV